MNSNSKTIIAVGDQVRVRSGRHTGRIGIVLKKHRKPDSIEAESLVLIKFSDETTNYFQSKELIKASASRADTSTVSGAPTSSQTRIDRQGHGKATSKSSVVSGSPKGKERRKAARVKVTLNAYWEGVLARQQGTVSDISLTGCFILSGGDVTEGELIRVEIQLPSESWLCLWGEVVKAVPEIGFGVRFTGSSQDGQITIEQTMNDLLKGPPPK